MRAYPCASSCRASSSLSLAEAVTGTGLSDRGAFRLGTYTGLFDPITVGSLLGLSGTAKLGGYISWVAGFVQ